MRAQRGIAIDALDYGVCPAYIDSLRAKGAKVYHTSRWLNGATIEATKAQRDAIRQLPFVASVLTTGGLEDVVNSPVRKLESYHRAAEEELPAWGLQQELFNLLPLHNAGYRGENITVAVIDGGFWDINTSVAFDSIRKSGRLLGQLDFASDGEAFDGTIGEHGAVCLGLIAGNTELYQGAATQAKFYAIKSEEYGIERPKEVDNLVAALEACDSLGVWIASISLGYAQFDEFPLNYVYSDLDGHKIRSSHAANIAARKGMLVCVAAGNTGSSEDWPWISSPADADSILTVGAVGYDSITTAFSSIGPTADGRIKPEVLAVGHQTCLINAGSGSLYWGNGTSFATPLIAGLAACLWSALPGETNMQIRERIIRSSHYYATPDNKHGYGIPDTWKAYKNAPQAVECLETVSKASRKALVNGKVVIIRDGAMYDMLGNRIN